MVQILIQSGIPQLVSRCFGGSETCTLHRQFAMVQRLIQSGISPKGIRVLWCLETRTLNRKFPMLQSLIQSRMSPRGIWAPWRLPNPYFESQIPNGSKSQTFMDVRWCSAGSKTSTLNHKSPMVQSSLTMRNVPKWYLGAMVAQKLVLCIAKCQWFQISYSHGCSLVVSRCSGGSKTFTLNRPFPMVPNLMQSGISPSGIWVPWCLRNPYFESPIPNGSKSHTIRDQLSL